MNSYGGPERPVIAPSVISPLLHRTEREEKKKNSSPAGTEFSAESEGAEGLVWFGEEVVEGKKRGNDGMKKGRISMLRWIRQF